VEFVKNPGTISFPLKSQKMSLALKGARGLVIEHYESFCAGKMPPGYFLPTDTIPQLGPDNKRSNWGKPEVTYLKLALMSLVKVHLKVSSFDELDIPGSQDSKSAMTYFVPVPLPELSVILQNSAFKGPQTVITAGKQGTPMGTMTIIHSGYGFGMPVFSSVEEIYAPLSLGPVMDCSAFVIAAIGGGSRSNSSYDFPFWEAYNDPANNQSIPKEKLDTWAKTPAGVFALQRIQRVDGPLKRNDIYWHPGHIALILGVLPNGDIASLDYSRDIEKQGLEGFGWTIRPHDQEKVKVYRAS
jgi:hypothetical protein